MQSRMEADLVMRALIMAMWKRKPDNEVVVHSDQGSQYTSSEWQDSLEENNLKSSMSRRGNCHDNAVAESFFQLLKRASAPLFLRKLVLGIPAQASGKNHVAINAFGAPIRPAFVSLRQMTRRRFGCNSRSPLALRTTGIQNYLRLPGTT